jgi:DNA-binding beta-propeller fold protein YncE
MTHVKKNVLIGASFAVALVALVVAERLVERSALAQAKGAVMAPRFEVDPTWPKPLPNGWYQGQTIGVWADANDHIWIVHRPDVLDQAEAAAQQNPPTGDCCKTVDPILEFDQAGNLLRHWGGKDGPGYQWPDSNHGLNIDSKGNVWIGGNGTGDGHVLKFTQDGGFIMQVGRKGVMQDSLAMDHFFRVAKTFYYGPANEVFVADGYGNRRVAVIDAETGKMKRLWGAYGKPPDDKAAAAQGPYDETKTYQQFRGPVHCADVSVDNLVYVCDRTSNRLQIFNPDGTFVKEVYIQRDSRADGAVWDVAFSRDAQQRFLYVADGRSQKLRIFDRQSMTELTNFGKGGHYPGEWYSLHSIATDSKGNLYTAETYQGRRVQRFMYKGLAPVTVKEQGVPWPTARQRP